MWIVVSVVALIALTFFAGEYGYRRCWSLPANLGLAAIPFGALVIMLLLSGCCLERGPEGCVGPVIYPI